MTTSDRLANLRHDHPLYFWVWRRCVAVAAWLGHPAAVALDELTQQTARQDQ